MVVATVSDAPTVWEQVADLRPKMRSHLRVHVHAYRGEPWYVVEDRVNGRFHRFDAVAYRLIRLLNGERTVGETYEALQHADDFAAPDQAETVGLVSRLHAADLLATGLPPSAESLFKRYSQMVQAKWKRGLSGPLALRVPLLDPDAFLTRTVGAVRWFYTMPAFIVWVLAIAAGGLLALEHWGALAHHLEMRALDPKNVAVMWALYPCVKAIHELGHAWAVKHWGGAVHEVGVVLLVFTPVPYVDASASTAFADKRHRMLVAAAGIIVELLLAALALFAWLHVAPGLASDILFNVMLIGAGSTLLFNGNPLLRFDGYHVLADALEIPNLGHRANRYLIYLVQRYLLGMADAISPATTRSERKWLLAYGIAALFYRCFILLAIALWLATKLFFIGVMLALWVLIAQIVMPVARGVLFIVRSPQLHGRRKRAALAATTAAATLLGGVLFVPLSAATRADGVVQSPPGAEMRAGVAGTVTRLLVRDGQTVRVGEPLVALEDPLLPVEVRRLEWRLREVERRHAKASLEARIAGQIIAAERDQAEADLDEARERFNRLTVRATTAGTVSFADPASLPGRFVERGTLIARVIGAVNTVAHVVVPQDDATREPAGGRHRGDADPRDPRRHRRTAERRARIAGWRAHPRRRPGRARYARARARLRL